MKQTAVEWLVEQIFNEVDLKDSILKLAIHQAKAMEKEQLIMFGAQCMVEVEKESGLGAIRIYELYYNETFKSE
jgi:hypothetical protein